MGQRTAGETTPNDRPGEVACCRICFDDEESPESGRLFSPCKCSGSMRYVHVTCLNRWRASSVNQASFYKCGSCHYEYRFERVRVSSLLLSARFQQLLAVLIFLLSMLVLGLVGRWLFPSFLDQAITWFRLPLKVHLLFMTKTGSGNPACWDGPAIFEVCCVGRTGGNPACWDRYYTYDACCLPINPSLDHLRLAIAPILQVFGTGWIALSIVGFSMFLWREAREYWGTVNGSWHMILLVMWVGHMNGESGRFAALLGAAVALREFYRVTRDCAKWIVTRIGEH